MAPVLIGRRRRARSIPWLWPTGGVGLAVWGFTDSGTFRLWDEKLMQVFAANYGPPHGGQALFVEEPDGHLIGIVQDAGTEYRQVVRWTPDLDAQTISAANVVSFPTGAYPAGRSLAGPLDLEGNVFIDPAGEIYFSQGHNPLTITDPDFGGTVESGVERRGIGYYRLSGATLGAAGDVEIAVTRYTSLKDHPGLGLCGFGLGPSGYESYTADDFNLDVYRRFAPAVLSTGRWVAADPGRIFPSTEGAINAKGFAIEHAPIGDMNHHDVGNPCPFVPPPFNPCPPHGAIPNDFVTLNSRAWGDAWWTRPDGASGWSGLNTGVTSASQSMCLNRPDCITLTDFENGNPTASEATARNTHTSGFLPSFDMDRIMHGVRNTAPYQEITQMIADDQDIYLLLHGLFDMDGVYHPGGIYRSAIPAAGNSPSWTQVVTEPMPAFNWPRPVAFTVSRRWIWIGAADGLRVYPKAGGTSILVAVGANVASLTPANEARWKAS